MICEIYPPRSCTQTSNHSLLARLQCYPLTYYHAGWQHSSTSLNSFRQLWASTRNPSVWDCKDKRDNSPQVSVPGFTIGIQWNLNPCTDFQWEIWIFKRRESGQKAVHPKKDQLRAPFFFFFFSNCLHCQNQSTLWFCCSKDYVEAKLQTHTKPPTPHNS